MNDLVVEVAQREKIKIPVLLSGVSGSGKTVSALLLAYGIVSTMFPDLEVDKQWLKIGLIDTEHRRASLNANREFDGVQVGHFEVVNLNEPYTIDRYEVAFNLLLNAGCEVIIIDSISHNWEGKGGVLEAVDKLGGRFTDWNKVKPLEERFRELSINNNVHVISTARVKQDYVMEMNDNGKMAPRKVGLKYIQKDNLEYEFAVAFRIEQGAIAYPMKDNSGIFSEPKILSIEDGKKLFEWSEIGIDVAKIERERKAQEDAERADMLVVITESQSDPIIAQTIGRACSAMRMPLEHFSYQAVKKLYQQIKGAN
ncbi:hypothetical protein CI088_00105 [Enterococcus plantarum]|uniref:AAA+ ATPase domain-containing protein n=1 Tax=Enterococcus plantarum TaxID=1077675 RepID=A0A2W4BX75_9ENTE|nr:AAA family ATPase [Enterococcus plantarum]PZL78209.1 hypothetical protein CI088_00105 [Enterococcus plantarum]